MVIWVLVAIGLSQAVYPAFSSQEACWDAQGHIPAYVHTECVAFAADLPLPNPSDR